LLRAGRGHAAPGHELGDRDALGRRQSLSLYPHGAVGQRFDDRVWRERAHCRARRHVALDWSHMAGRAMRLKQRFGVRRLRADGACACEQSRGDGNDQCDWHETSADCGRNTSAAADRSTRARGMGRD
jgi:hypothetical protein